MIKTLVLFGATGDLAGRYLFPALAKLQESDRLPDDFAVVGSAEDDGNDEVFRSHVTEELDEHAADVAADARDLLVRSLRYQAVDFADSASVAEIMTAAGSDAPLAAYLALPPSVFPAAVEGLGAVGLPEGSRLAIEKPFGVDLDSAVALNGLLGRQFGATTDDLVYRVDHVLGMATVQNLLGLRFANRVLEPVWNSAHIEQVEIAWEETIALEGRAGFYDHTGALEDVMQNHMTQVLCVAAMEPPAGPDHQQMAAAKLELLRAVRSVTPDAVDKRTRRARYTEGRLADTGGGGGRRVPDYVEEAGVDPGRSTETFAEVVLSIDNDRWAGTPFVLRAGKAMAGRRKGVTVRFRPAAEVPFPATSGPVPNELWIGIDGPRDISLRISGSPHPPELAPLVLAAPPPDVELPAYARVLLDILGGGGSLSVGGPAAEEAWRIFMPVIQGWAEAKVPMEQYEAGSSGPPSLL
ncbi:MAG: glucose-6-phosphate dehydrogenase [Acidimicrobiia bacterium]